MSVSHSSITCSPHGLRPKQEDRHYPEILCSRGYVADSGRHPSPRYTRSHSFQDQISSVVRTSERLTRPYSGGLTAVYGSLAAGNHCQVSCFFKFTTNSHEWTRINSDSILEFGFVFSKYDIRHTIYENGFVFSNSLSHRDLGAASGFAHRPQPKSSSGRKSFVTYCT